MQRAIEGALLGRAELQVLDAVGRRPKSDACLIAGKDHVEAEYAGPHSRSFFVILPGASRITRCGGYSAS